MARSRRGSTFFAPIRKKTRWERFKEFLWNPETNQVLGRSASGWFLIIIFYVCLYAFLGSFFLVMMLGLNSTLDDKMPKFILDASPIGKNPGLSVRPRSEETSDMNFISFKTFDENSWKPWVKQLSKELKIYASQNNSEDCLTKKSNKNVCFFDIAAELGDECTEKNNFGFNNGEPCVLLKINKIIGWEPEAFNKDNEKLKEYKSLRQDEVDADDNYVGVTCSSSNAADKNRIGTVSFYPASGFNKKYFPYMNQKGYLSPLVMVQFKNLEKNDVINIECKIWAKNIEHDRQKKRGSIRFEIMIKE